MFRRKYLLMGAILAGIAFGLASPADAAFRLRVEDVTTGDGVVLTGTVNPVTGMGSIVVTNLTVGNFTVTVAAAVTQHNSPLNFGDLDLNNLTVSTNSGDILRLTAEDTDYTRGAGTLALVSSFGGTIANGIVTGQAWANGGNAAIDLGPDQSIVGPIGPIGGIPAGSVAAYNPTFTTGPTPFTGAFAGSGSNSFTSGPPTDFALFSQITLQFGAGGGSSSGDLQAQVLPVPAGLILVLSGAPCLGLGVWLRRLQTKVQPA
jgi:hypothetical protein